jgi:hypothetical protein
MIFILYFNKKRKKQLKFDNNNNELNLINTYQFKLLLVSEIGKKKKDDNT